MKTWTIHEAADALLMTTGELSQWISRGHYRPSEEVRPGQRRRFDWRDLACLAVMGALRPHCLSINAMGLMTGDLREDLATMDRIPDRPSLFFFAANWTKGRHRQTVGLVPEKDLCTVLRSHPESVIVVDVTAVYRAALARLPSAVAAGGAAA
ncbi:MerR family transcriptional regulator [Jannaschia seohaensis]|uniref:MerR HTH family regulatory protein n=1 Tax=Jannaschia seohaensis TaxID=475081 RepID=A0A2Y9B077_9RHOB|nr:MerR family transcriptional regulator [Jannaschia seohaensis]PWJ17600.1 MerR-like DNA binding protein [Jannaschia seohaensis]SSA47759.1 MerR HTH family regulatory protein [Jannaschia seohaensis]